MKNGRPLSDFIEGDIFKDGYPHCHSHEPLSFSAHMGRSIKHSMGNAKWSIEFNVAYANLKEQDVDVIIIDESIKMLKRIDKKIDNVIKRQ